MRRETAERSGLDKLTVDLPDHEQRDITVTRREGVRLVELSGDQDVTTIAKIRAAIFDDTGRDNIVLSLERVTFIDSSIIGAIFTSNRALLEQGIHLVVHCPVTTPICRMLQLASLDNVVDVVTTTLEEAIDRARNA